MDLSFQRLLARARPMGNPARKYIHVLERHGDLLLDRLEATGHLSRVHIDRTAPRVSEDFSLVASAGTGPAEKLKLLGTFYAIQFLHLNARALERLALDLAEHPDRHRAYWSYLNRVEEEFNTLVTTYMSRVLRVVLPSRVRSQFAICAVGTILHQDDIDVMVVVDPAVDSKAEIDAAVARLGDQMLRFASILDHYLAGQVVSEGFCVTPDQIGAALRAGNFNYVMVTELLRAVPLVGERQHFRRLQTEVVDEYYFKPDRVNHRHELYLRGILGEARSLLLRPPPPGSINPKADAQRLIMGLTTALKTVEGLKATQPRELLRILQRRRPGLKSPIVTLSDCLSFLETVRHLSQLFIAMEDEIEVGGDPARENLQRVAEAMGFHDRGPVRASDFLLVHYHETVELARKSAEPIMEDLSRHLSRISRISRWVRTQSESGSMEDFATALAAGVQSFRGVRFWDDFLEALAAPDRRLLRALSETFAALDEERQRRLAEIYGEWGRNAPYAFLTVLTLLGRKDPAGLAIVDAFLDRFSEDDPEAVRSMSRVYLMYPDLMNRFLLLMDTDRLNRMEDALDVQIGSPEISAARDRFRFLVDLHRKTSRYVKRVLERLTVRYPATILALDRGPALKVLALGRLAAAERQPSIEDQKGFLGDYYDMEFLRIATETLRGTGIEDISAEFAELTRTYLSRIMDTCVREAEKKAGERMAQRDRLALFLTGGNARGRPYDEDFDLIVLVNSNDPQVLRIAEMAVVRFNRQIARRGVIAQYRLGEHFGRYVNTVDELGWLLDRDPEEIFVDCCQLINSRLLVGSRRVERALVDRVLRPKLFDRPESFLVQVAAEIRNHRADYKVPEGYLHLKEMPGALREIDLCIAAAKARHGIREVRGSAVFGRLIREDPERAEAYETLSRASNFLVALRSAYRVSVAASDVVERAWLWQPASILGYALEGDHEPAGTLFETIRETAERSEMAIDAVLAGLEIPVTG